MPQKLLTYHLSIYFIYFPPLLSSPNHFHISFWPLLLLSRASGMRTAMPSTPPCTSAGREVLSAATRAGQACSTAGMHRRRVHVVLRQAVEADLGLGTRSEPRRAALTAAFNTFTLLMSFKCSSQLAPMSRMSTPVRAGKDRCCQCFRVFTFQLMSTAFRIQLRRKY